jgi:hypothetical protein
MLITTRRTCPAVQRMEDSKTESILNSVLLRYVAKDKRKQHLYDKRLK